MSVLVVVFAGAFAWFVMATGFFDASAVLAEATVLASVAVAFGIAYAADGWWGRRERYGLDRESNVAGDVGVYLVVSVLVLTASVLSAAWESDWVICPTGCEFSVWRLDLTSLHSLDPIVAVQWVGVFGVFYLLFGAVPLAAVLIRAPDSEPVYIPSPARQKPESEPAGEAPALRLPPAEFVAVPDDPFGNDTLNREAQVRSLVRQIRNVGGHPMIMLDGGWGSGKTAFLAMCQALLEKEDVRTVSYNAWTDGYTQEPLQDLAVAVARSADADELRKVGRDLSGLRRWLTDQRTVIGTDRPEQLVERFTQVLGDAVAQAGGRLVILVDELDRCRPPYAVGTLETARNLFAVDGVTVLVAVNRQELGHAVRRMYGSGFDADAYLRRFADIPPVRLPTPPDIEEFLDALPVRAYLKHRKLYYGPPRLLRFVLDLPDRHLRDVQQAAASAQLAMAAADPEHAQHRLWEWGVVALVVVRVADPAVYQRIVRDELRGFDVLKAVRPKLPPWPASYETAGFRSRADFEAVLLILNALDHPLARADFSKEYVATGGEPDNVDPVQRSLLNMVGTQPHQWKPLDAEPIGQLLSLLPPTPSDTG